MIYTNLKAVENGLHGMFESSLLLATDVGNIYDLVVRDESENEISVDNGVAVHVGAYTGNGLQERYATIAKKGEKIAVIGAPANNKTAMTKAQEQPYNYTNPAGKPAKAYQIQPPEVHNDIFAVASYQFTDGTSAKVKIGAAVVVDEKGAWEAHEASELETLKTTYGFVGTIHSIAVGTYYTMVRIKSEQNKDIA